MKKNDELIQKLVTLQDDLCDHIMANLKRVNRVFASEDDDPIEFFTYSSAIENDIDTINPDGSINEGTESLVACIRDGYINLWDGISILRDLEEIE